MIASAFIFIAWTLYLYLLHRLVHITPVIKDIHRKHHVYALTSDTKWRWNNLFLYNDNWIGTLDFWLTEVIPNLIFCYVFNVWWLFILFWVYAGLIQEHLEHNDKINYTFFTAGQWHLIHHRMYNKNYGLYIPLWDKIFKTEFKQLT